MKNFLLVAVAAMLVISCTKDNVSTLEVENQNLTVDVTAKSSLDFTNIYAGVFGHNTNPELHGKVLINITNAEATISLTNGTEMRFIAVASDKVLEFIGDGGTFTFDVSNLDSPLATKVFIGSETEAYIVTRRGTRGAIPMVTTGTYIDGADATFFGNWDMIGDGNDADFFGSNGQLIAQVIVSHVVGVGSPFSDLTMETPAGQCTGGETAFLWDPLATGDLTTFANNQTSVFKGPATTWGVERRTDLGGPGTYVDDICVNIITSGFWSWNGRAGTILADN